MPAPNPSNRERLLRLIDGGTEALKEMQPEEVPLKPPPLSVKPGKVSFAALKTKFPVLSTAEMMRLAKWVLVFAAIVAALHYGLEMMKTMKQTAKTDTVPSTASAQTVDESGVGLRLVGVDSSDASPVALLEDIKTGKTYFARVNEKVKDARVKQIQKNKVVVSYHGKNVELR